MLEMLGRLWNWIWPRINPFEKIDRDLAKLKADGEQLAKDNAEAHRKIADLEQGHEHLKTKHDALVETVRRLELQFELFSKRLDSVGADIEKLKDRVLNREFEDAVKQEQIKGQLQNMDTRLNYMLNDVQASRQLWVDKAHEPEVQKLLAILQNTSNQIGGKRRSINSLMAKLDDHFTSSSPVVVVGGGRSEWGESVARITVAGCRRRTCLVVSVERSD